MDLYLLIVLQKKFEFLETLATIGMTWWVSSVVFCASIFAGVWINRADLLKYPDIFFWLSVGMTFFFLSVVTFGVFIMWIVVQLNKETKQVLILLNSNHHLNFAEFTAIKWGMGIGTTSFILVTIAWLMLWANIRL